MVWILLALGGALGALTRYSVAGWVYRRTGAGFPWGTLAVNLVGSFLFGVIMTSLTGTLFQLELGALLAIGFLGDLTTFSTFSYETAVLIKDRQWMRASLYLFWSTGLSLLAVVAGMICGTVL